MLQIIQKTILNRHHLLEGSHKWHNFLEISVHNRQRARDPILDFI